MTQEEIRQKHKEIKERRMNLNKDMRVLLYINQALFTLLAREMNSSNLCKGV